jgi:hypothetical protein
MSRLTLFSLILIASGLLLLGFQSIQALMGVEIVWKEITLEGLMSADHVQWVQSLSWSLLRKAAVYVIAAPLYAVLLAAGVVLLIASGIFSRTG